MEMIAEETDPVTPNRTLPFVFEVSHPVCGFDECGAAARFRPRQLNAVGSAEVSNSLCRFLHRHYRDKSPMQRCRSISKPGLNSHTLDGPKARFSPLI